MLRTYLRLIFNGFGKILFFFKNYKKLYLAFIKPYIYKKKIIKVLEINKSRLANKQGIIKSTINQQYSNSINFVR